MSKTGISLGALYTAFADWAGPPTAVSEFRHSESDDNVPTELDVLFFQMTEDTDDGDAAQTFLATAGMSTRELPEPYPHIELFLDVPGMYDWPDLLSLGERLAELAVLPFAKRSSYAPGQLIYHVSMPLYHGMTCLLVTEWGGGPPPEWLPDITPLVRLLALHPLYESEADVIAKVGVIEAYRRFTAHGVDWSQPDRLPAPLDLNPK